MVRIHLSTVLKRYQAEMRPGINPISNSSVVEHPVWGRLVSGSRIVMGDEDFHCTTINTKELFNDPVSKSTLVLRGLYSY